MSEVWLVHWKEAELPPRVARLERAGCTVDTTPLGPDYRASLKRKLPDAVVIDLSRLPSHGRELGSFMRRTKVSRHLPLVFVDGAEDKIARVRKLLPDAVFCSWRGIGGALKRAIHDAPADPVVPSDGMSGYSGTPLWKKLGVKAGTTLALCKAPDGIEADLGEYPDEVILRYRAAGKPQVLVWFVRREKELLDGIERMKRFGAGGGLWIAWQKKGTEAVTDLTQTMVRRTGLDHGLVDFKICSINRLWSGLRFSIRS